MDHGIIPNIVLSSGRVLQKTRLADVFLLVTHKTHLGSQQQTKTHSLVQFLEVQYLALKRIQEEVISSSATAAVSPPTPPTGMTG